MCWTPVVEYLQPPYLDAGLLHVDPVVRNQVQRRFRNRRRQQPPVKQADGDEVAILEPASHVAHARRRLRRESEHQIAYRHRGHELVRFVEPFFPVRHAHARGTDAPALVLQARHRRLEHDRHAERTQFFCRRLPHLARTVFRIKKMLDERGLLGRIGSAFSTYQFQQRMPQRLADRQAFDPHTIPR